MIHAFLFVTKNNKDHDAHGEEFQKYIFSFFYKLYFFLYFF